MERGRQQCFEMLEHIDGQESGDKVLEDRLKML